MDKVQKNILNDDELNSLYITSTNIIEILNKIKTSECDMEEIASFLKSLKYEQSKEKEFLEGETFDIFGGMINDSTKINMINNKKHREIPRDKFNILEINKHTNRMAFKKIQLLMKLKNGMNLQERMDLWRL